MQVELEREGLRLWVWDMVYPRDELWDEDMEQLCNEIERNRDLLISLKNGSEDFTLHLAVYVEGASYPFSIPNHLARLSTDCGFDIEVYVDN
ncbi:MAG: hypothetical protein L3J39_06425 [Verrucomicrobiales bacterium]|nr:hypothetical protein [Verrucomicrobiales bacterium]